MGSVPITILFVTGREGSYGGGRLTKKLERKRKMYHQDVGRRWNVQ